MGNITDEIRIQKGLIEQAYYDEDFDKDDRRNYYKERGRIKRERYISQLKKIQDMPEETELEICAKLRKYYGFAWRYNKNLSDLLYEWNPTIRQNFINAKVLTPWKDTVWLDKDKLQEFEDFVRGMTDESLL